jgi:hypothetical protein
MISPSRPDPRAVYSEHLDRRRREIAQEERAHVRIGNFRLLTALAGLAVIWLAVFRQSLALWWVVLPLAGFIALIVAHERVLRRLTSRRRAAGFYARGLARLDGVPPNSGDGGARYADNAPLYGPDLDIFGPGSLFELLCTARTHIGEDTLARWLSAPAAPAAVRERQEAVDELRPAIGLREDLAVLADEARTGIDPVSLAAWGESAVLLQSRSLHLAAAAFSVFGAVGMIAGIAAFLSGLGAFPMEPGVSALCRDLFFAAYVGGSLILYRVRQPVTAVVSAVEEAAHELNLLTQVLVRLEREQFQSPCLRQLRASLDAAGSPPSQRIARLNRLMEWLDSRDNVFVKVVEPVLLYSLHLAFAVEDWRATSGPTVRRWLEAAGEIEALSSLASYAFEHPADPFPVLETGEACFEAEALGHPLLPENRVVRNDVALGGSLRVLVVSGSNMSGKSTLLRTIGINAVLAQAGAPVRARGVRMSPLQVGASIRVSDSLQGGMSRFYAEIVRLRDILAATSGPLPVIFLLDEFLHGTNSHDRRVGAEAMVRGLVNRGAIGLITTHDLALAHIADELGERGCNVHFEDRLENGVMTFDYVMRPGVVRKSNAIELMRSVGLEI